MTKEEAYWGKFSAGLYGYISDYYNRFIKTDYQVNLTMSLGEVQQELMTVKSIDELSAELKKVAIQFRPKFLNEYPGYAAQIEGGWDG